MGVWKAVSVAEGYLIVNTGEELEKKTAGMIQATLHRVIKPEGEEAVRRLASIFFALWSTEFSLKPFDRCVVEQTWGMSVAEKDVYLKKCPAVTVTENLLSRLIEMGSILDPMGASAHKKSAKS